MALRSSPAQVEIGDTDLKGWNVIGSGGFGQIYKARHCLLCCDVAIKLLHYDDGTSSSLLREVHMMRQGSSPHVIHVYGLYKGRPPSSGPSVQLGIVMEFMERGSLASMQTTLHGPPPWPLAFRLCYQVAQGINFLHSLSPALLHLDLKPNNVLLDSSLNAKLTDFGLAKFYHSVTRTSKKDSSEEGGTINYMPPEAFSSSYSPTQASDIYSYGILLWSIVTGKKPYANALSSIVRFRIPKGDRPLLDEIRCQTTGRSGLTRLMDLMKKCWEARPIQRPSSFACTSVTEELYKMHKHAIQDSVHQVLKKLDQKQDEQITEQFQRVSITQAQVSTSAEAVNNCDNVPTGRPPVQEKAGRVIPNERERTRVKDSSPGRFVTDSKMKASSVHPIQSSSQGAAAEKSQPAIKEHVSPQYQRQFSSPDTFPCPPARVVNMHFSSVMGLQIGNNNEMHINQNSMGRRRHPTAPVPSTSHCTK